MLVLVEYHDRVSVRFLDVFLKGVELVLMIFRAMLYFRRK